MFEGSSPSLIDKTKAKWPRAREIWRAIGEDKDDVIPDMTAPYWAEKFAKAAVSRGRPKLVSPKVSTTIRFDADVLARFRAGGAGWQPRINEALRQWLDEHSPEA